MQLNDADHGERGDPTPAPTLTGPASSWLAGIRILLVDDIVDVRDLVVTILMRKGATVRAVGSAQEALAVLAEWSPDVLVSDIGLPGEDGYELIRQVRLLPKDRGGDLPAVALTAYAALSDEERARAAGYQMHVPKPVELSRLVQVIRQLAKTTP